jgi:GT2 family glycosyltransferase
MLSHLETPYVLRVIRQPNLGQPAALNRGASEAVGRNLIFIDDDIMVVTHFVAEHLRLHHNPEPLVGIGQITLSLSPESDWFARGFAQSWSDHYAAFNQGRRRPDWDDCYGGNMSVSRDLFMAVGGNITDMRRGYDIELAYRLKQYGCSFQYVPEAVGVQHESKSFRELSSDAEFAGEGSVVLARRHPATEERLFRHFYENRRSWLLLWRLLSFTGISARGLERLQRLAGRRGQSFVWFAFFSNYYFWRGVHRAAPERTAWKDFVRLKKRGNLA